MGKVAAVKRGRGGRSRSKGKDSDDSDEDYMIEEDEDYIDDEEEDKLFSSEEDENDDAAADDDEEETEQCYNDLSDHDFGFQETIEEEAFCKTAQIKRKRSGLSRMKLGTKISNIHRNELRNHNEPDDENESQTERFQVSEEGEAVNEFNILKRKRSCLDQMKVCSKVSRIKRNTQEEFDDEDYNVEELEEEDDDEEEDQTPKLGVSEEEQEIDGVTCSNLNRSCLDQEKLRTNSSNSRRSRHGKVDDEDYNFDDDEEDEDDEDDEDDDFTLDESFSLEEDDDEEEHVVKKKKNNNKPIKRTSRKKSSGFRKRKKRTNAASKVCKKKKESRSVRRNVGPYEEDDNDDCEDEDFTMIFVRKRRTKKKPRCRTRNFTVHSDSDLVDSGPSEIEFTISEEEREQVREASNICRKSTVPLRSSFSSKDSDSFAQKRKLLVTKGKEKIPELKKDVFKQVCGICFSEEGKNTARGALNSCSHYFCFTCILEWSKVESRCPLCKQRFKAITKSFKANTGVDSKDVVFPIPERDQVYQPTEEEIRGYLDPYENVICTECREGGDDELMLLCDLCDSPAHTYCVGLEREVPEGNWYCEGCRPASLGPSNNQIQDSITGQRNLFHRLSSFEGIRDDIDGSFSTPSTSFPQGFGSFLSPRYHGGSIQASSPRSGTGAVTVSGRRQIRRQMHLILSNNRSRQATETLIGDTVEVDVGQSHSSHRTSSPARPLEIGTSFSTRFNEESCNTPTPQSMQFLPMSTHQLADQLVLDTTPILDEINVQEVSRPSNISTSHNVQPFIFSNNTNVGCDYHMSSSTLGVGSNFYLEEQVKPLVQNHLESMSRTLTLGPIVREEIERKSQNTILAACGHLHHPSEVFPVPLQPRCIHSENPLIPTSPLKDHCISCFNTFAKEVVKTVMNSKLPHFLRVRD